MPFGITHLLIIFVIIHNLSLPGGSDGKKSACNAGDVGSISGLERSPAKENGIPLQYSCLENPMNPRSLVGCRPMGSQRVGHD